MHNNKKVYQSAVTDKLITKSALKRNPAKTFADAVTASKPPTRKKDAKEIAPKKIQLNKRGVLGQIHVYHGNGKGKSTAALGLAIRAAGQGKKVGIVYFDKGGTFYGERRILDKLKPTIRYWVTGLVRFQPGKPFRFGVTAGDKQEAKRGLIIVRTLFNQKYDLVIMDEINSCAGLNIVTIQDVRSLLQHKPKNTEVVMTGRNCPLGIRKLADLVTEMKLEKHYFYKGVPARQGIEF